MVKKEKRKLNKSVSKLKKKLDGVFSKYIRARDSHICFTCGKRMEANESQDGHYVSRAWIPLRWDERNNNCQCVGCNVFKKGNLDEYAIRLRKKYGETILEELWERKWQTFKLTTFWLESRIVYYQDLIKTL